MLQFGCLLLQTPQARSVYGLALHSASQSQPDVVNDMRCNIYSTTALTICFLAVPVLAGLCFESSPAFPVPKWGANGVSFDPVSLESMNHQIQRILDKSKYDIASASIELTSDSGFQHSYHHTARKQNKTRPGTGHVNGHSHYRIASITKAFTTLAILQQHAAGNLSINDPVNQYISELARKDSGALPWKDITIRALASQLSGIPREFGQSDLFTGISEPWKYGLPPETEDTVPPCTRKHHDSPCSEEELLRYVKTYEPLLAPNQQSTYSNLNFELLGIVIERVSGLKYIDYVDERIFKPLNMTHSTFKTPSDESAVIPDAENWWDADEGALNPTGGIYSTASDMSKFLRYVLTHYNALVTGVNWFQPASFSSNAQSMYGMPWEIFKTDRILHTSRRPVTFITKGGGVPSYFSNIIALPEYNLGITILVGGPSELLTELREVVTTMVVRAAEKSVWQTIASLYTGTYTVNHINSSVSISSSAEKGIKVDRWISNGTDVLGFMRPGKLWPEIGRRSWHLQLVPTLLYKNETTQQGEIFRMIVTPEWDADISESIWDDFCITDIDVPGTYAGLPSNEIVFWHERNEIELPAWRVTMRQAMDEQAGVHDAQKVLT